MPGFSSESRGGQSVGVGPNQQAVFIIDYEPRTVNVSNDSEFDGSFLYAWVFAATVPATPAQLSIAPQANVALRPPPPDRYGDHPRTLLVYNNSGVMLQITERRG